MFVKSCEECQKYGHIQNVPASELHSIVKPWPFRGWVLDLIGQIHPASSKGHMFILVRVDYFTKWVETIALKDVTQQDMINFIEKQYCLSIWHSSNPFNRSRICNHWKTYYQVC